MSVNPFQWIRWLAAELGPSSVLRERLGLSEDHNRELERKLQEQALASSHNEERLKQEHAKYVVRLKQEHAKEIDRFYEAYMNGKIIPIPDDVRKRYSQHNQAS
jgi:hypothetical protein